MSAEQKATILDAVASSTLPKHQALRDLGVPKSTYYRWLNRHRLDDRPGGGPTPWNRLSPEEEQAVLTAARQSVGLSCRQLAAWLTDSKGFSVSESTVYRILRREGLVKSPEMQLKAGKEYHRKTSRPHRMWATDASYFRVIGWGFYYLVTVMDDYSRFILAHKLQRNMTSDSFIEVVQDTVDRTGMTEVPVAWDVDYWVVERSMAQDGPWEAIAAMRPGELRPQDEPPGGYDRWADAKLPPGDRYYYRIYACTPVGGTVYSNVVSGVVPEFMPGLPPPIEAKEAVDPPC